MKEIIERIHYLLHPERIAVIGASRSRDKIGRIVFENLLNAGKEVYPVNPHAAEICGVRCYPSIKYIEEDIDLAIIAVPSKIVNDILIQCGKKGVKAAIIYSAGFSESGNYELERKLAEICREYKIAALGPNCMGVLNTIEKLNMTFSDFELPCGNSVWLSQSGALGSAVLDIFEEEKTGIKYFISVGNCAVLTISDFIEYFSTIEKVDDIFLYLESIKEGRRFLDVCRNSPCRIYVLKGGKSKKGQEAALSHTAALASPYVIYKGLFKQARVVELYSLEDMLRLIELVEWRGVPPGRKVLVVTNAGGPSVLLTDALEEFGFELPKIDVDIEHAGHNPIDLLGDATSERFSRMFSFLDKIRDQFDILVVVLTPQKMTDVENIAREVAEVSKKFYTVALFIGGKEMKEGIKILRESKVPTFRDPACLARVLNLAAKAKEYWERKKKGQSV